MDFTSVSIAGVLLAALAGFAVGALWFSPKTFFPMWWKAMGKTAGDDPGAGANMGAIFSALVGAQIVQSIFMTAAIAGLYANASVAQGALTGVLLGIGIAASTSLSHRLFSGHGNKAFFIWALEVGNDIVGLAIIGAVVAAVN